MCAVERQGPGRLTTCNLERLAGYMSRAALRVARSMEGVSAEEPRGFAPMRRAVAWGRTAFKASATGEVGGCESFRLSSPARPETATLPRTGRCWSWPVLETG